MKVAQLLLLAGLLGSPEPVALERRDRVLSESQATEHFEIRYRPGSRAGASVDRTAHLLELEYAEVLRELDIEGKVDESEPFEIYLYDDLTELTEITGVEGVGGYSAGRESHIPWNNDQTRKHELVHIVVAAMKPTGDEPRNMFFAEGISNAVLEFVHGIPVHSVAAYELKRGSLPALEVLVNHEDFYAFLQEDPNLNAYDVAGSFFLFLLETHKPARVMDYYHGKSIRKALGKSLEKVEEAWHAHLRAFPIRPELDTLLSERRGDGGSFDALVAPEKNLSEALIGEPKDWTSVLSTMKSTDEIGQWEHEDESIRGRNSSGSDWSHLEQPDTTYGDCVLRLRAKIGEECWGIKLRYGAQCEAMLLGNGAFIYTTAGGVAFSDRIRLPKNSEVDLILHVRKGRVEVYVDEARLLEADLSLSPSTIGVGLVGGEATLLSLKVRRL